VVLRAPGADAGRPGGAGSGEGAPTARPDGRRGWSRAAALAWLSGAIPLVWAGIRWFGDGLGANPIEEAIRLAGIATLLFLLASLAVTPLRRLTGRGRLIRARRPLGLLAFSYAVLHFLLYAGLDQTFELPFILEDVAERPYITVGFTALVLLLPLAVTSTRGWIRRLGRGWVRLHRLVYGAAGLGVLHFYWQAKADTRWAEVAVGVLVVLLAARLPGLRRRWSVSRRGRPAGAAPVPRGS